MPIRADAAAVMAKAPIAGAVKTRLAPFLSAGAAAELARALLIDQLNHLSAIESADLYLAFSPHSAGPAMRQLAPARFELIPQTGGDLGARMENIFATLFAKGHKNIVLIGADLPPVPLDYFAAAYDYLDGGDARAALGPSRDGGYYLLGLNRRAPELFSEMTWSHDQVWTETVKRLTALGMAPLELPQWFDIDRPNDLTLVESALDSWLKKTAPNTSRVLLELRPTRKTDSIR